MRTTWAPRGQTPILRHHYRRGDNISMAGFICYHPDRRRVRLLTDHTIGAYHTGTLIQALRRLPRLLDGAPVILVWDGLSSHRSAAMNTWLTPIAAASEKRPRRRAAKIPTGKAMATASASEIRASGRDTVIRSAISWPTGTR